MLIGLRIAQPQRSNGSQLYRNMRLCLTQGSGKGGRLVEAGGAGGLPTVRIVSALSHSVTSGADFPLRRRTALRGDTVSGRSGIEPEKEDRKPRLLTHQTPE